MKHLRESCACICIASGSEQTVAFICSGLRSLRVWKSLRWGGSNFMQVSVYNFCLFWASLFSLYLFVCLYKIHVLLNYRGEFIIFFFISESDFFFFFGRGGGGCEWRLPLSVCYKVSSSDKLNCRCSAVLILLGEKICFDSPRTCSNLGKHIWDVATCY